jgi:hypothetical protein
MTIGQSSTLYRKFIRNPEGLKLKKSASDLLDLDPELFLKTYGRNYVHQIKYGGSFLGIIDVYGKTEQHSDSLSIFASLDVNEVMYSVSASEDFEKKTSDASSYL